MLKRHCATKHTSQFNEILGQIRVYKIEHLKKSLKKQGVFASYEKDSELSTKLTFELYESMAEKRKPFGDGEFSKNCLTIFTEYACPEKKFGAN